MFDFILIIKYYIIIKYMSGYENKSVSSLGGGVPGKFEVAYGNTLKGGQVALNRKVLRKAFKTNKIQKVGGGKMNSRCGPFRSAYQLGDPLTRKYASCGGCSQVNDVNSKVLRSSMSDSVSNTSCNLSVHGITPLDVSLSSGNNKFVADSSLFTKFKHLESINLTYNDKSGGGDNNNGSYSFLNNLRG